jgi:enamine deaminase RidA (YjgF/YER057c/UK114 family)
MNLTVQSVASVDPKNAGKVTPELINPPSLVKPSGYAHGVVARGRLLALAGQTGMDATGRIGAPGDLVAQFRQALANLRAVVSAAGGQVTDIVKLTLFVTDKRAYRANLTPLGAAYREVFGRYYPAMTLVEVRGLFDDEALVEIEGLACLPEEGPRGV